MWWPLTGSLVVVRPADKTGGEEQKHETGSGQPSRRIVGEALQAVVQRLQQTGLVVLALGRPQPPDGLSALRSLFSVLDKYVR